jgi:N-acetylglucosaminyl-diphospho-decaprenol L-rhamnosyltransferase
VLAEVFIPTYRGVELLPATLDALGEDWRARCTVIDNASTDGTSELLASRYPQVNTVRLHANAGFGRAINAAVDRSPAEVLVVLNDDVVCEPRAVDALVDAFTEADTGMAAAVLVAADTRRIESAGLACDPGLGAHDLMAGADPDRLGSTAPEGLVGPSGGFAAYRRSAFDTAGGFDPGFFAYYEDLDLALRLRRAGWQARLVRSARGVHMGSASVGWRSVDKARLVGESRGRILRKYQVGRRPRALPWLLVELVGALLAAAELRSIAPVASRVRGFRACSERAAYPDDAQIWQPALAGASWKRLRRRFARPAE